MPLVVVAGLHVRHGGRYWTENICSGFPLRMTNLADPMTVEKISRTPQQGRSKASLERMMQAARALIVERGDEDFTLIEVSKRGKVSIGSIYLRFESKDNLVRAVIAETMNELAEAESAMLRRLTAQCPTLIDFIPAFVEGYAAVLTEFASVLSLAMLRAESDPQVAEPGKRAHLDAIARATQAMLSYDSELTGSDKAIRANAAYHVIFATLARQLSLGSIREPATDIDWQQLKDELGRMTLAYLKAG